MSKKDLVPGIQSLMAFVGLSLMTEYNEAQGWHMMLLKVCGYAMLYLALDWNWKLKS